MARAKHLDLDTLQTLLEQGGLKGRYVHEGEDVDIQDVLGRLFAVNRLNAGDRWLLRLFALLPQRLNPFALCRDLFADVAADPSELADSMERLAYTGWLQAYGTGYSMHPVIAEAVLAGGAPAFHEYPKFWAFIRGRIDRERFREWPYVDIASCALLRGGTGGLEAMYLLLDTAVMEHERYGTDTAVKLLDRAFATARAATPPDPSLLFDCYAVLLYCKQNYGIFDRAEEAVREVLRLFPEAEKARNRAEAIGFALFFAVQLSLKEEARAALGILREGTWEGHDYAKQNIQLSIYHTIFAREFQQALELAEKALLYLRDNNQLHSLLAGETYKLMALTHGLNISPSVRTSLSRVYPEGLSCLLRGHTG